MTSCLSCKQICGWLTLILLLNVAYLPLEVVSGSENFYQSEVFLLCVASHYALATTLLVVFSFLEDGIGRELYRTLYMTVFHVTGFILYIAAAGWTLSDTHKLENYIEDDAEKSKLKTAGALGIIASFGHLACGVVSFRSWRAR